MDLKLGADPEFFLRSKKTGELVSAHGLIPGTKDKPYNVRGGAIQVDGMAIEFNVNPAKSGAGFSRRTQNILLQLEEMLPDYDFVFDPSVTFSDEVMKAQPPEAIELGCEPDFNAWKGGEQNPQPDGRSTNMRTGAGHLHFGWTNGVDVNDEGHLQGCIAFTKALDISLLLLSKLWDDDDQRRSLYGNPGAFRPKPYGLEYRSLSNAWLKYPQLYDGFYGYGKVVWNYLIKDQGRTAEYSQLKNYDEVLAFMKEEKGAKEIIQTVYGCMCSLSRLSLTKKASKIDLAPSKPQFNTPKYKLDDTIFKCAKNEIDFMEAGWFLEEARVRD